MKIFIDSTKWAIIKEEKESPFFEGENFASKLRVYINDGGTSFPTLSLLKANGRKRGPFNYDPSGYGVEITDSVEWHFYEFTLSTINGALDVPGQLLMTCIINSNGSQRAFNFSNNVVKTAIDYDSGIVVYGDEPTDIINDIGKNLDVFAKSVDGHNKAINNINKKIPYGDRTYVYFNHLSANSTIENLFDALVDNDYIIDNDVEYKFYIKLGDGTILENIHIKSDETKYEITSIIRNGIDFKVYMGYMWFNYETPTIVEFIAQHSTIVTYKDIDDFVNSETLGDVIDSVEEQIPYGDRKYYWLYNITKNSSLSELITELKNLEAFDENNEGKFYIKLSDDTVLESIHIKLYVKYPTKVECCYINSIIRELKYIKVYLNNDIKTNSTMTINELINEHNQIATMQDIANLINSAPATLDTLGELAIALEENKDIVEALDEAIGNKADKTYVDEKIANAGVPSDLLNRVETLETLSEEAVYMEDTEFDVEEETGGSGSGGKEVVNLSFANIVDMSHSSVMTINFENIDFENKYLILDFDDIVQEMNEIYQGNLLTIDFALSKQIKNSTLFIKLKNLSIESISSYMSFSFSFYKYFNYDISNAYMLNADSITIWEDNTSNYLVLYSNEIDGWNYYIKIDFDENGFAYLQVFNEYEN